MRPSRILPPSSPSQTTSYSSIFRLEKDQGSHEISVKTVRITPRRKETAFFIAIPLNYFSYSFPSPILPPQRTILPSAPLFFKDSGNRGLSAIFYNGTTSLSISNKCLFGEKRNASHHESRSIITTSTSVKRYCLLCELFHTICFPVPW